MFCAHTHIFWVGWCPLGGPGGGIPEPCPSLNEFFKKEFPFAVKESTLGNPTLLTTVYGKVPLNGSRTFPIYTRGAAQTKVQPKVPS
jgi:hypothetical protein